MVYHGVRLTCIFCRTVFYMGRHRNGAGDIQHPRLSASIVAEETGSENLVPNNADAESEKTVDNLEALPVETITLPLPRTLPDGRGIRPIALFSSQMDVLVSKEFLPVALEQLRSAFVSQQSESSELLSTQISSSQYVVELQGDQLICRRGSLRVSTKFAPQTTIPLGRQSVAVHRRGQTQLWA